MAVTESNMTEFKMAAIFKLSQIELVKLSQSQSGVNQYWQVLSESERKITKVSESKHGQIQDGRIQVGCHHQVKWEWMSLSQIELVWVRVRVEWEYFWVNLREDNKVSESKMAVAEFKMADFKLAAIFKLSQIELVWNVRVRVEWEPFLASVSQFERR